MEPPRKPEVEEVEISRRLPPKIQEELVKAERNKATAGMILGFAVIIIGALMIFTGPPGAVALKLSGMGLSAQVANAAPGVVLALLGVFIIFITRLVIREKK